MSDQAFSLEIQQWLSWLFKNHPGEMEPIPFIASSVARQNDKRPARITLNVPDEWVKNIKGEVSLLDSYLAIKVPGEYLAQWKALRSMPESQRALFSEAMNEGFEKEAPVTPPPSDQAGDSQLA